MTYFKKPIIIQTPLLTLPFGIQYNENYNKVYVKMKFPRLQNPKQYAFLEFIKNLENYILTNKFPKIWKKLCSNVINKDFRSSLNKSNTIFTTQLLDTSTIYNDNNMQIDSNGVLPESSVKGICILSGLWIHKNIMGPLWSVPQLKVYDSPISNCMIIDEPVKITPKTNEIECPCCSFHIDVKITYPPTQRHKIERENTIAEVTNSHIFEKYVKMQHLGVPIQAVHQKIVMEGHTINGFEIYLREKSAVKTNHVNSTQPKRTVLPPNPFSMSDLLNKRKHLKKAKIRKKIKDDSGFIVPHTVKSANSNMVVPTLQDIVNSMKSLKSTGIKLN
jgi:hypothetical protein